jgi:hypothetical protein
MMKYEHISDIVHTVDTLRLSYKVTFSYNFMEILKVIWYNVPANFMDLSGDIRTIVWEKEVTIYDKPFV